VLPHAATSNLLFLDTTNGWAADDVAVIEYPPGFYGTGVVATAATADTFPQRLGNPLPFDVPYNAVVREFGTTNHAPLAEAAADATTIHIAGTNGFLNSGIAILAKTDGGFYFGTITSGGVTATNLTLEAGGFGAIAATTDRIYPATSQAYTVARPADAGERTLALNTTASLLNGDRLAIAGSYVWPVVIVSTNAAVKSPRMTLTEAPTNAILPGARLWHVSTNLYATYKPAAAGDSELWLNTGTGLAAGDHVLISPAIGAHYVRQITLAPPAQTWTQLGLSAVTGVAVSVGDVFYKVNSTNQTPVGATTLRLSPTAWVLPQAAPALFLLDGTSACSINSITVNYGQ
jgi:hypothetical protein